MGLAIWIAVHVQKWNKQGVNPEVLLVSELRGGELGGLLCTHTHTDRPVQWNQRACGLLSLTSVAV